MPWLAGTAFLHSVMMQEKRGMMKVWNVWLIFATFMLSILGTLLTRSGLVSSVHAFAESNIGNWFYTFLLLVLIVCLFTFLRQRDHLRSENRLNAIVSRESSFLFNNLVLLSACIAVLVGTLFPVISEYVTGSEEYQLRLSLLQQGDAAHRPVPHLPHRSRPAARVARHFHPFHSAESSASMPRHHRQRHCADDHRPAPLE